MHIVLLILCLLLPLPSLASEINAGFVDGLWYSSSLPVADEPTRMYVAVRNNTDRDLTGTVEFFVDGERIGRDSVQVIAGRIIEAWADWTPSYGEHTISARLTRVVVNAVGSSAEEAVAETVLAEDTIFIDYDTDNDNLPNATDSDDDNDNVSDEDEIARGSNPLIPEPKPKSESDTKADDDDREETKSESAKVTNQSSEPAGLEQYLTESRAKSTLSSVTNLITTAKTKIDDYRETRNENDDREAVGTTTTSSLPETPPELANPSLGTTTSVGEITRSTEGPGLMERIIKSIVSIAAKGFDLAITAVLASLSLVLGHPILLQVFLLILILFLFLKLARRMARRPG